MGQTTPQSHIRPFGLESIEVGIRVQTWTHLLDMRLWVIAWTEPQVRVTLEGSIKDGNSISLARRTSLQIAKVRQMPDRFSGIQHCRQKTQYTGKEQSKPPT
jgi:hypothetical protein